MFAVHAQSPARSEVSAHTCIPRADRLFHAAFTPVAEGCSGRALSALVHTRLSWTCWSCLADRVQLLMQIPLFPAVVCCGQSASLPNSCTSSPGGLERDLILCDFNDGWPRPVGDWQGKKWREEPSPAVFPLEYSYVSYFQAHFTGKV